MAGIRAYFEETVNELVNKVSWPTQKELQSSAIIVLVTSVIFALVVFVMDFVFGIRQTTGEGFAWKGILGFFYDMFK
ncbi:MAG: preprotein translocase subunit SecE [Bacteroidota bacterium]